MTTPQEELHRNLQDPEFRRLYGASLAKSEAAMALGNALWECQLSRAQLAARLGCKPSYVAKLLTGDANVSIVQLGKILAALGWRLRMTVEPLEKEGSK